MTEGTDFQREVSVSVMYAMWVVSARGLRRHLQDGEEEKTNL